MENGDETLASPAAAAEETGGVPNGYEVPVGRPVKSYAAVAAENPAPNGGVAKESVEDDAGTGTGTHTAARSYAAVAASAEIEDLRAAKLDLEGKLADARRENKALAAETHRLEGIFMQAREEVTIAEVAATSAEKEHSALREEVERLQAALKIEKGEHELEKRGHEELAKKLEAVRQEKLRLEEEIKALKASATATAAAAAAAATKEREAAPAAEEVGWQGIAVAAAAGAAGTLAVVLIYLRVRR